VAASLKPFILPLIAIRNRRKGYAVSMIKAGMKAIDRDSGPVGSPLTDLTEAEIAERRRNSPYSFGASMSQSPPTAVVYVGAAGSNAVTVLALDGAAGRVTPMQTARFEGVDQIGPSTPLAISPDRRFLFAGVRAEPYQVVTFAIDPKTGGLTQIGLGPLPDSMAYLATDQSGRFLFGASYGGSLVAVSPIGPDGLVRAALQSLGTGPNAHAIVPAPDNRFVLATNLGSDEIRVFRFDAASGALTPRQPPAVKTDMRSGPRHLAFHPNAPLVFLLGELDAVVRSFAYDAAEGRLTEISSVSAMPPEEPGQAPAKPWGADIHLTPDGRFLYVSERTTSSLTGFSIDPSSGGLTQIEATPTEKQPRGFAIDPTGRFLAAVGEVSDSLTLYAIDQKSGRLTPLHSLAVGSRPNWVAFFRLG
jgi:6-phosphogluconolactonase